MGVWTDKTAMTVYAVSVGAIFFSTGGMARLEGWGASTPAIVQNCEAAVKNRIRSPAGYRRVSFTHAVEPVSRIEVVHETTTAEYRDAIKRFDEGSWKPQVWRATIEFDAPNGFGAVIRSTAQCDSYFDLKTADRLEPRIWSRP